MKKCPKCDSEMFQSMEPKVTTLANINSKLPNKNKYWRCSKCDYRQKVD